MQVIYVYRCWDREGQLLYVGITADVERRRNQHAQEKYWWSDVSRVTSMAFQTRFEALWAEWAIITTCNPVYNRVAVPPLMPAPATDAPPPTRPNGSKPVQPAPETFPEDQLGPRQRVREIVAMQSDTGIGPRAVYQQLQAEGYVTVEQTVISWMRADALAGILAQPGGPGSAYLPGWEKRPVTYRDNDNAAGGRHETAGHGAGEGGSS